MRNALVIILLITVLLFVSSGSMGLSSNFTTTFDTTSIEVTDDVDEVFINIQDTSIKTRYLDTNNPVSLNVSVTNINASKTVNRQYDYTVPENGEVSIGRSINLHEFNRDDFPTDRTTDLEVEFTVNHPSFQKQVRKNTVSIINGIDNTSCSTIQQTDSDASSGVYEIDPDGDGGVAPFEVYCEMDTAGGGWTRFWWYETGDISSETDFLSDTLKNCSVSDSQCFAQIPISSPNELLVKTDERNGGTNTNSYAAWKFDSNTDTAQAAQDAFTNGDIQPIGNTNDCWDPFDHSSDYDPSGSGCSQEFWYDNNNGVYSFNLDDDTAWAYSAFQAGHPENRDEDINAVDCLETDGEAGVQRQCELYYK